MAKVIEYKEYIKKLTKLRDKLDWKSEEYAKINSRLNRIVDWEGR